MKNLLQNKIFITMLLFVFLLASSISNVYCAYVEDRFDTITPIDIEVEEILLALNNIPYYNDNYYYVVSNVATTWFAYFVEKSNVTDTQFYLGADATNTYRGYSYIGVKVKGEPLSVIHNYKYSGGNWVHDRDYTNVDVQFATISGLTSRDLQVEILTNLNIYYDESCTELFFQGTPQVISQVATMEITQVEALPMAIIQIVEIILPVFLIVFGVLLVLYLIKSKNLLHL